MSRQLCDNNTTRRHHPTQILCFIFSCLYRIMVFFVTGTLYFCMRALASLPKRIPFYVKVVDRTDPLLLLYFSWKQYHKRKLSLGKDAASLVNALIYSQDTYTFSLCHKNTKYWQCNTQDKYEILEYKKKLKRAGKKDAASLHRLILSLSGYFYISLHPKHNKGKKETWIYI